MKLEGLLIYLEGFVRKHDLNIYSSKVKTHASNEWSRICQKKSGKKIYCSKKEGVKSERSVRKRSRKRKSLNPATPFLFLFLKQKKPAISWLFLFVVAETGIEPVSASWRI